MHVLMRHLKALVDANVPSHPFPLPLTPTPPPLLVSMSFNYNGELRRRPIFIKQSY